MLVKLFKTIVGISSFTYVKLFLTFFLIVSPNETFAQRKCEILYRSEGTKTVSQSVNMGAKLLHQKDPQLHISRSVEKAVATHKRTFKETLQKPAEKIDVWLKSLEKISNRAESSTNTLIQIKTMLQNQFVLKLEDIPQSYYDLQVKLARERGLGDIILVAEKKRQLADILINDQKKSLDYWIEYLVSKDTSMYPMWLKYWMFTGMTKLSKYHPQTGKFDNRDKGTVAPFADLNREALGLVADHVLQYLNKRSLDEIQDPELVKILPDLKFGKIYGHILFKLSISKQGVFKTNQGRWVIFKKGSDHMPLVKSLEGRNTGWCSAGESTAMLQLQKGDFHVYYSLDAYGEPVHPRVAIRMEGDDIAEVRGVAANQNLDPQINQSTVVSSKMKEFGSKSDKYQKRERDMKLLTQIETKQNAKISLEKEELKFLWELENTIEGFGYDKDPRIEQIRSQRDFKSDVIEVYGNKYTREEITTTTEEFIAAKGTSKIHLGNLHLDHFGSIEGLKLPEILNGSLYLNGLTSAEGLKLPDSLSGNLYLNGLTTAQGLKFPNALNGSLSLNSLTMAQGLKLPDIINGYLSLNSLTSAEGLRLPDTLNGDLGLRSLITAQGLKLPDTLNGNLDLRSLTTAQGLKLPDTLNGYLYLHGLTSAEGLKLPDTLNGNLILISLTTAQGLKLPDTLNGNLDLRSLITAQGLKLPDTLNGNLNIKKLTTVQGLERPKKLQNCIGPDDFIEY